MKTKGRFAIVIRGSTDATRNIAPSSWSGFQYLIQRLVVGEEVAETEFSHYGLEVEFVSARRDPWENSVTAPCAHSWAEVTTMNDRDRRWHCAYCSVEVSRPR